MMGKNVIERYDTACRMFLADQAAVGVSEKTVENYRNRLNYFGDFLRKHFGADLPEMITSADVKAWRDDLSAAGRKASTVKQYLVELKAFFSAVCDEDAEEAGYPIICNRNPVSKKMFPHTTQEDARPYDKTLTEDDYKVLWANERPDGCGIPKAMWARNYAIVVLLLDSKIRNEELLDLRLCDIDFEYNEAVVRRGKGNKYRIVTLSEISITAIQLYLASGIRPAYCTDDDLLFGTEAANRKGFTGAEDDLHGSRWHKGTRQWLSALVERHVFLLTGKKGFKTHAMRHAGAALDLNAGASMERIQAELGHASISTTQIYTDKLKSIRRASRAKEIMDEKNRWAAWNKEKLMGIA